MKIIVQPKYQSASAFIAHLTESFRTEGEAIYAGRNMVKRFDTAYGEWIVKRYKKPNLIQRLAYTFWRKSKAERAFLYARKLNSIGIDTPEGIGYAECRKNGLFHTGYFISTACNYPSLYPALVKNTEFDKHLASALASFLVSMHCKGVMHGDPNPANILYHTDEEGRFSFSVIDTNRSVFKTSLSRKECLDNLKRVTHRRDLLQYVVEEYATLRKWDVRQSVEQVMHALSRFEKRRQFKRFLKPKHSS